MQGVERPPEEPRLLPPDHDERTRVEQAARAGQRRLARAQGTVLLLQHPRDRRAVVPPPVKDVRERPIRGPVEEVPGQQVDEPRRFASQQSTTMLVPWMISRRGTAWGMRHPTPAPAGRATHRAAPRQRSRAERCLHPPCGGTILEETRGGLGHEEAAARARVPAVPARVRRRPGRASTRRS